jgi:ABC-type sugar transport system substrate-binding protein
MMKKIAILLLAIAMILTTVSCSSGSGTTKSSAVSGKKTYKIGVSIMELTAYTWYQGVIDGCKQWQKENGDKNGVELKFDFQDSHSDVSTMLTNIENMAAAGSNGIILFPADASSAIPIMKQYVKKGIPFIVGDYAQQTTNEADKVWSTFVGHDMKALGNKAGEVAVKYLKTLGKDNPTCLYITRPTSGQVSADRAKGFSETVLAAFPKARIVEEGDTGAGTRDSAQTLVENILQREKTIDVVCGHNDAVVVGAYNAAIQQGRKEIKFIGIAGDKDILTWITQGNKNWLAEVLQDPVVLGYQATEAIYRVLAKNEKLPAKFELPQPVAITPDVIKDYNWKSWAWLG